MSNYPPGVTGMEDFFYPPDASEAPELYDVPDDDTDEQEQGDE